LIHFFSQAHGALQGRLLEGLSKLFAQNVRVYAYPATASVMRVLASELPTWQWEENSGWITADAVTPPGPLGHLYSYLIASGFVVPMRGIS